MPELSPEQWAEVEELFAGVVELPPDEHASFLERECHVEVVRREVASLLVHAGEEQLAIAPAIAAAAAGLALSANPDERLVGAQLGPYLVEAIAGHGGMGAVYRARRNDEEFQQKVAIKLVRAAAESPTAQQRFRQERQILARLSHPNIACLLDGGSTPENVPYLVMEFIEGEPITRWCDRHSLTADQRVRVFLPVCSGVDAANREMIIHRDLKPANILVTLDGVPKLLDFGIAKLLDPVDQAARDRDPSITGNRLPMMTPEYAAPEQVRGDPVTAATDVYSLGLVLYEILTGSKAQTMPDHTPHTLVRVICEIEPVRPAVLRPQLAGDLDHIVRKAIRKEPTRRYPTAAALGDDLRLYLAGHPVTARADTFTYKSGKFLRRNKNAAKAGLASAAFVAGSVALLYWLGRSPRPPHLLQVTQLTQDGHVDVNGRIVAAGSKLYFNESQGGDTTLADVAISGGAPSRVDLGPGFPHLTVMDISPDLSRLLVGSRTPKADANLLWIVPLAGGAPHRVGDVGVGQAIWSRDGKQIFFLHGPGLYRVDLDGTNLRKILTVPVGSSGLREAPAPQPDVLRFTMFAEDMRSSSLWEVNPDGSGLRRVLDWPEFRQGRPDVYYSGAWNASGSYYMFRARENAVSDFWALREKRGLFPLTKSRPVQFYSTPLETRSFAPSRDGKRIFVAAAQQRREIVRYDARRGQFLPFLPGITGGYVVLSSSQHEVVFTSLPENALWKCGIDGSGRMQLSPPGMRAFLPQWSPDGRLIAFTGSDRGRPPQVYLVSSSGGTLQPIGEFPVSTQASWSPNGTSLLFYAAQSTGNITSHVLYIKDLKSGKLTKLPGSEPYIKPIWSPNPRYIAAMREGAEIVLYDFATGHWSHLTTTIGTPPIFWSADAKYLYYQEPAPSTDQPIYRLRVSDRHVEKLMSSKQIPQSGVTSYSLEGLTGDDAPFATVVRSNSDIYALDVELP